MAKKLLCIVLSVTMLLGMFAIASSAGDYYSYTPEEAEAEVAEKLWYVDYEEDVDWKDEIDRRWLTGTKTYDGTADEAAAQDVLEYNLYFWEDEIIAEYNAAATNEDYWNLYNKMATPEILYFTYEGDDGEMVTECDIFYDYAYEYRDESKATIDVDIQADKAYAMPGDTVTVDVRVTTNFLTAIAKGGIFYDKTVLTPVSIELGDSDPTWLFEVNPQFDLGIILNNDGSIKGDNRAKYWPEAMYTEENLAKYGCAYVWAGPNTDLLEGTYGRQFDNETLFTATFKVNEDVAEGTAVEFFIPEDVILGFDDVGYVENNGIESVWTLYRVDGPADTKDKGYLIADYNSFYDQTFTSNVVELTVGPEPVDPPVEPEVKGEIVDVYLSEAFVGDVTEVDIEVTGSPEALHFMEANGGYKRVARETATIIEFNGNELWTVDLFVEDELLEYTVYADYGDLGSTDGKPFVIVGTVKKDLSIHSIEIPDMYPDAKNGGMITAGKHDIIIKTSTDVTKIQFYAEDGTTYTYTSWTGAGKVPYEDIDGERVWTINHAFGPFGYRSLVIRTRSADTFFAATNSTLDATVVY